MNNFVFPTWARAAVFYHPHNNNGNNNNNNNGNNNNNNNGNYNNNNNNNNNGTQIDDVQCYIRTHPQLKTGTIYYTVR